MSESDPFSGEGEVRAIARSTDWSSTPLGPVDRWPRTLRDTIRTCLDSPLATTLWCGPELVLVYNDAYGTVLGSKHPEAFGRPGAEVWSEIWDEIAPYFAQIRAGGPPVYEEDAPFALHRTPGASAGGADDRPNAWFTFSLSPVRDEAGELLAYLNIVSESTGRVLAERARKAALADAERAEQRLRDIFAQAPAFLALVRGPNHVLEYVNDAYYQVVGHRDLVGLPTFDALPELRDQGFRELLDRVLETGEPFVGREVRVAIARTPASPPEDRFLDFVYYPITEADGTRSGVVAHGSDVTDHVRARREAQRARVEAERANRAKSQFLATMSHEIRTPINAVVGYADLLDAEISGPLSEPQRKYVQGIKTSSSHLLGLISDVLDLAKIEAGELVVEVEEFEARPVLLGALHIIGPQAEKKEIAVAETWDCADEVRVLGDDDRMRQILLNLLSNSLKFTEAGGSISVDCRVVETASGDAALPELGPWLVVRVEDTGRGIPDEELGRIFEPFRQVEGGHTRTAGGTGLGLTISRRLARLMGGELTVRSEVGTGSSFSLWLAPAVQERVVSRPAPPQPSERWPPAPEDLPGLASTGKAMIENVLAIEDEWAERLRSDRRIRVTKRLNRAQLTDQTAELVVAMGKVLIALEEGGGDPALVGDAEEIHSLVAVRHGRQRRRLGFGRGEVEREYGILADVLDQRLRREAPKRTAADLKNSLSVVRRLVERASARSLSVYDGGGGSDAQTAPG